MNVPVRALTLHTHHDADRLPVESAQAIAAAGLAQDVHADPLSPRQLVR